MITTAAAASSTSAISSSVASVRGGGKGKRKIEMKRIEDRCRSRTTFAKRRQGLFKKAAELDTLCGSETAVVSVSDTGKVYSCGQPSLLHRFLIDSMGWEELDDLRRAVDLAMSTKGKTDRAVEHQQLVAEDDKDATSFEDEVGLDIGSSHVTDDVESSIVEGADDSDWMFNSFEFLDNAAYSATLEGIFA